MLVANNLTYHYSANAQLTFPNWEVPDAGHALILGPSGSGKTTLLHLLSGLLRQTGGHIELNGTALESLSDSALDKFRGAEMGFVFQKPHLVSALSVSENIKLASFLGKKKVSAEKIHELLDELQIAHLADRSVHQISQGQAQRLTIARAVVNQPAVIFADEPTASLDDQSCEAVVRLLKTQAEACKAMLIIATHDQRVKSEFPNQLTL